MKRIRSVMRRWRARLTISVTGRLVRRGPILVRRAKGVTVSQGEADAALEAVRQSE